MVGGMGVHKNKFVEAWVHDRENLELRFKVNPRSLGRFFIVGIAIPVLSYYAISREMSNPNNRPLGTTGRFKKTQRYMGVPYVEETEPTDAE